MMIEVHVFVLFDICILYYLYEFIFIGLFCFVYVKYSSFSVMFAKREIKYFTSLIFNAVVILVFLTIHVLGCPSNAF